jgi:hypothetical protein
MLHAIQQALDARMSHVDVRVAARVLGSGDHDRQVNDPSGSPMRPPLRRTHDRRVREQLA